MVNNILDIILGISVVLIASELFLLIKPWHKPKVKIESNETLISIIVCARNEESFIADCIESLINQTYKNYEIIVLNDHSTDKTGEILATYVENKVHVINVDSHPETNQNPKAFLLNIGRPYCHGEFIAIADADCVYAPHWIASMVEYSPPFGLISGVAGVLNNRNQHLEWLAAIGRISLLQTHTCPTAIGNNMMVRAQDIDAIGGFSVAMDSMTEDVRMNHLMNKNGINTHLVHYSGVLSRTNPITFKEMISQRKRWIEGVKLLPIPIKLVLYCQSLWLFLLIGMIGYSVHLALLFLLSYSLIKMTVDVKVLRHFSEKFTVIELLKLEMFRLFTTPIFLITTLFGSNFVWKNRQFKMN